MSAEIIQFGAPRPRKIVPVIPADRAVRDQRIAGRPSDLLEAREARDAAWRKVDAERRYFSARLKFLDAVFFAHRARVLIVEDHETQMFPVEEEPYLEEHHRLVEGLRHLTEQQLRLPASCSQQVNWKRSFALGGGWPKVTLARSLIQEYIDADEAFLKACPRKPRSGYRKGRDT
jgi:hypothetical protein